MKLNAKNILMVIVSVFAISLTGFAMEGPTEIPASIDKIFIPHGFDDNDTTEIVLFGKFFNSCYKVGNSGAEVDHDKKTIRLWATSYHYDGEFCAQAISPYIQSVKLGILFEGTYTIAMKDDPTVTGELVIRKRTTESPDDHLYAPVHNAAVKVDAETGRQSLKIQGTYPYTLVGCMVMQEVRMDYGPNNVLVVLPIMDHMDGEVCENHKQDFDLEYGLPQPLLGENLLHIRVLNGNAYNRYVNIQ